MWDFTLIDIWNMIKIEFFSQQYDHEQNTNQVRYVWIGHEELGCETIIVDKLSHQTVGGWSCGSRSSKTNECGQRSSARLRYSTSA